MNRHFESDVYGRNTGMTGGHKLLRVRGALGIFSRDTETEKGPTGTVERGKDDVIRL